MKFFSTPAALVQDALSKSYSYAQYRKLVTDLIAEGKSTGPKQSADLLQYSELNEARMSRLDKTSEIYPEIAAQLEKLPHRQTWIAITEGWCGDAAQILPYINKMAKVAPNVSFKCVLRDENPEFMDYFLTGEARSIPRIVVTDTDTFEVYAAYGPRPFEAAEIVRQYRDKYGVIDEKLKIHLQKWYNKDAGMLIQREFLSLVKL